MELDYTALGQNIRKHRKAAELTQAALAEMIGKSDRFIGQIETTQSKPSLETVVAIANALNVGVDRLVSGDLKNRWDYIYQELDAVIDRFDPKKKLMHMELAKAIAHVLKDF